MQPKQVLTGRPARVDLSKLATWLYCAQQQASCNVLQVNSMIRNSGRLVFPVWNSEIPHACWQRREVWSIFLKSTGDRRAMGARDCPFRFSYLHGRGAGRAATSAMEPSTSGKGQLYQRSILHIYYPRMYLLLHKSLTLLNGPDMPFRCATGPLLLPQNPYTILCQEDQSWCQVAGTHPVCR